MNTNEQKIIIRRCKLLYPSVNGGEEGKNVYAYQTSPSFSHKQLKPVAAPAGNWIFCMHRYRCALSHCDICVFGENIKHRINIYEN